MTDRTPPATASVGEIVRDARKRAGLSQQELATRIGLASNATISRIEDDRRPLTVTEAQSIADACGVDRGAFLASLGKTEHVPA